jgi:hypothetical protein
MIENFITPLADYFKKLGGKMTPRLKATRILHNGGRVTGVRVAEPAPPASHCPTGQWPDGRIAALESVYEDLSGYDAYVFAVPHDAFLELNPGDSEIWNATPFSNFNKLKSAGTVSCRFWCKQPAGTEAFTANLNRSSPCNKVKIHTKSKGYGVHGCRLLTTFDRISPIVRRPVVEPASVSLKHRIARLLRFWDAPDS